MIGAIKGVFLYKLDPQSNRKYKLAFSILCILCIICIIASNTTLNLALSSEAVRATATDKILSEILSQVNADEIQDIQVDETNNAVNIVDNQLYDKAVEATKDLPKEDSKQVIPIESNSEKEQEVLVKNNVEETKQVTPIKSQEEVKQDFAVNDFPESPNVASQSQSQSQPVKQSQSQPKAETTKQADNGDWGGGWDNMFTSNPTNEKQGTNSEVKQEVKQEVNQEAKQNTNPTSQPVADTHEPTITFNTGKNVEQTDAVSEAKRVIDSILSNEDNKITNPINNINSVLTYPYSKGNYKESILEIPEIKNTEIYKGDNVPTTPEFLEKINEFIAQGAPLDSYDNCKLIMSLLPEKFEAKLCNGYLEIVNVDPYIAYIPMTILFGSTFDKSEIEIFTPIEKTNLIMSKTSIGIQLGYTGKLEFTYKGIPILFTVAENCQPYLNYLTLSKYNALNSPTVIESTNPNNDMNHFKDDSLNTTTIPESANNDLLSKNNDLLQQEITDELYPNLDSETEPRDITKLDSDVTDIIKSMSIGDKSYVNSLIDGAVTDDISLINIYNEDGDTISFSAYITDPVTLAPLNYIQVVNTPITSPSLLLKLTLTILLDLICLIIFTVIAFQYRKELIKKYEDAILNKHIIQTDGYIDYKHIQNL